jgi:ketosteroid isomerase-like protein
MADLEKHNEQVVRQFFETLSSGDLEKLRMMLLEQATWDVMVTGIQGALEKRGRKAIIDDFL